MRLEVKLDLSDEWVAALETVKALLITDERTGITHDSPLEKVYAACADMGLATLSSQMMESGEWDKYSAEVDLGNLADDILRDK